MTERRRNAERRLVGALMLCVPLAGLAVDERVIEQLDILQPRGFGYHIGDRFTREVKLTLRAPYVLDTKALPGAGRFNEFLTLEAPRVSSAARDGATFYDIRFDYQVVNVGTEASSIAVPHHDLRYSNGKETLKALVPDTRISVSPLRASGDASLQPDVAPAPLIFEPALLWACAGTLAASLVALMTLYGKLPSWRPARPFSLAHDEVRAAQRRGWRDEDYEAALRAVHRAFNATAGHTVFADALNEFVAEHPRFGNLEPSLAEFFARSRSHFFAAGEPSRHARYAGPELVALMQRCRDVERGLS